MILIYGYYNLRFYQTVLPMSAYLWVTFRIRGILFDACTIDIFATSGKWDAQNEFLLGIF